MVEAWGRLTSTMRSNKSTKKRGLIRIYLTAALGKPLANKWNKSPRHKA